MTKWTVKPPIILIACTLTAVCPDLLAGKKEKVREEVAVIDTSLGRIIFRFFAKESPKTVAGFKKLARSGFFDELLVHRVLPGLLIQIGDPKTRQGTEPAPELAAQRLELEASDLKHQPGSVSMFYGNDPSKGQSEFFICLQSVNYFDGKHTIIGEVVSGLKIVAAISNVPRKGDQAPLFPVRIRRIYVEEQEYIREVK